MAIAILFRRGVGISVRRPGAGLFTLAEAGDVSGARLDAIIATALAATCLAVALGFLAASILPARFNYLSDEPALRDYAFGLDDDEAEAKRLGAAPLDAAAELKRTLADQYAVAISHNRQINQRHAVYRSLAAQAMVLSIVFSAFLIVRLLLHALAH